MKKTKMLFMCAMVAMLLTGCGKNPLVTEKATVTRRDGKVEELTKKEICNIYEENQAKFDKYYAGGYITFVDEVDSIENYYRESNGSTLFGSIITKSGYNVHLLYNTNDILADLNKGDVIYVKTNIYRGFGCDLGLDLRGTDGSVGYSEASLKNTVVELVTGKTPEEVDKIKKDNQ